MNPEALHVFVCQINLQSLVALIVLVVFVGFTDSYVYEFRSSSCVYVK